MSVVYFRKCETQRIIEATEAGILTPTIWWQQTSASYDSWPISVSSRKTENTACGRR